MLDNACTQRCLQICAAAIFGIQYLSMHMESAENGIQNHKI